MEKLNCPGCGEDIEIFSADEVAAQLGVSRRRVTALARSRKVGTLLHSKALAFTKADIAKMQDRTPGNPTFQPADPKPRRRRRK